MQEELSIKYLSEEEVAMPATQTLVSAWNISTSFVSAQCSMQVCSARVYHKTGFKVHYAITLKSKSL